MISIYILLLLPVPSILDFQLNLTSWSFQYLRNLFLKLFTDSALTTVSGKLFQSPNYRNPVGKRKLTGIIFHMILMYLIHIFPLVAVVGIMLNFMVTSLSNFACL